MIEKIMVISEDQEVAKRLAMMLVTEGYIAHALSNLMDFKSNMNLYLNCRLIIDCQPSCFEDSEHLEFIQLLVANAVNKCLLLASEDLMNKLKDLFDGDCVNYLQKPILHSIFVKTVKNTFDIGDPEYSKQNRPISAGYQENISRLRH